MTNTLDGKLEPESIIPNVTAMEAAAVSTAISLKRIADALDGTNPWSINNLMENAGQAFALGMRGR